MISHLVLAFLVFSPGASLQLSDSDVANVEADQEFPKYLAGRRGFAWPMRFPPPEAVSKDPREYAVGQDFMDHNGRMCRLCGKPLKSRLPEDAEYQSFRTDCGSVTAPLVKFNTPLVNFQKNTVPGRETNAFCELNMQKTCADAIANRDYMYYAKAVDVTGNDKVQKYDGAYCLLNGWLEKEIVSLAHAQDFEGMKRVANHQCQTKYAKYNWEKITLTKMSAQYMPGLMLRGVPSKSEAEYLGAWNCAMGDAGCDMTYCAYTYCDKGDGTTAAYGECDTWGPLDGMIR